MRDIGVHGVALAAWRAIGVAGVQWLAGAALRKYYRYIREYRIASNEECMVPVTCGLYLHQRNGTVY